MTQNSCPPNRSGKGGPIYKNEIVIFVVIFNAAEERSWRLISLNGQLVSKYKKMRLVVKTQSTFNSYPPSWGIERIPSVKPKVRSSHSWSWMGVNFNNFMFQGDLGMLIPSSLM